MSHDWYARFRLDLPPRETLKRQIERKLEQQQGRRPGRRDVDEALRDQLRPVVQAKDTFTALKDHYARLCILAQTLANDWNADAKNVYQAVVKDLYAEHIKSMMKDYTVLGLETPRLSEADMALFPAHSFFFYVPFKLATPYMSKDDTAFYVHENPVRKEKVFKIPMVAATSWKGAFRAALRWCLETSDDDPRIVALLGNAKGEEKDFRRGRLSFYPTFFDRLEVEVINPHLRETSAGTQPIYIEQVPPEANGVFALLYLPLVPDEIDGPLPGRTRVLEDINLIGSATYTLLVMLGFGAKTANGMGRVMSKIDNGYLVSSQGRTPLNKMTDLKDLRGCVAEQLRGGEG